MVVSASLNLYGLGEKIAVTGWQWARGQDLTGRFTSLLAFRSRLPEGVAPVFDPGAFPDLPKGSESVAVEIERLIEGLARRVRLENPNAIREYLLEFTDLLDVIPEAVAAAEKYLPRAELVLDVYEDPEITDRYLVLYVRLRQYNHGVMERLEKAEAEFRDQLVSRRGWIQLTTDFCEPEGEGVV
jgi:hypothetical protein